MTLQPDLLDYPSFLVLTCKFFVFEEIERHSEPMHFVDFLRAGVKFELAKEGSSLLDITFDGGVLKIPKIKIVDSTESIWRNLMVFEQCHQFEVTYTIDYLSLLDFLIDDHKDVKMLIQDKIIENWLGTNEDVSDLFRKLRTQIPGDHRCKENGRQAELSVDQFSL
ncbi:hypothetical protein Ancab_000846 [Ancistrocladus abbreviatus]